jgi:hypothetical protein
MNSRHAARLHKTIITLAQTRYFRIHFNQIAELAIVPPFILRLALDERRNDGKSLLSVTEELGYIYPLNST